MLPLNTRVLMVLAPFRVVCVTAGLTAQIAQMSWDAAAAAAAAAAADNRPGMAWICVPTVSSAGLLPISASGLTCCVMALLTAQMVVMRHTVLTKCANCLNIRAQEASVFQRKTCVMAIGIVVTIAMRLPVIPTVVAFSA